MPLLHKKTFNPEPVPLNLQPNDQVFFCKVTGEVFTDYEKFFERVILCNSLVWSCSLTGRTGLTYQEANDSEDHASKRLNDFPKALQLPVLMLMTMTRRRRLIAARDDVCSYVKDRYFISEEVIMVLPSGDRSMCLVERVVSQNSNGSNADSDDDVICIDDDDPEPMNGGAKHLLETVEDSKDASSFGSNPLEYHYVLRHGDNLHVESAKNLSRNLAGFSRERCLLFLRFHCDQDVAGFWKVKDSTISSFNLASLELSHFFTGPPPDFQCSTPLKKLTASKKLKHSSSFVGDKSCQMNGGGGVAGVIDLTEDEEASRQSSAKSRKSGEQIKPKKKTVQGSSTVAVRESLESREAAAKQQYAVSYQKDYEAMLMQRKLEEEAKVAQREAMRQVYEEEKLKRETMRRQQEEERQRRKAQIAEDKIKKQLEKKQTEERLREWSRPREDLECDDLQALPVLTPVKCVSSPDSFGDLVFVLEYLLCFKQLFDFELPEELSLETLGKSLLKSDVDGLFTDILRQVLSAVFRLQEDELPTEILQEELPDCLEGWDEESDIRSATVSLQYPLTNYGTSLHKLQLDGATVSEVLRLHLLSSGAKRLPSVIKSDLQQRGGFVSMDDPGVEFCRQERKILEKLTRFCASGLSMAEKLKVLLVLIHQLLSFSTSRDWIDENFDRLKNINKDLRAHQWMEQRWVRDEAQFWFRKRAVDKQKLMNSVINQMSEQNGSSQTANGEASRNSDETSASTATAAGPKLYRFNKPLKDSDFENLPAENIDWEAFGAENCARLKEWTKRKEKQLMNQAAQQQHSTSICPIGRDRNFRRYWVFESVPGLFVEQSEDCVSALNCVPRASEKCDEIKADTIANGHSIGDSSELSSSCDEPPSCGDSSAVESTASWAFFETAESIDRLLASLNVRGFREGPLRAVLCEQADRLRGWLSQCNVDALKSPWNCSDQDDCAEENLECILREMILDFEERIFTGSLGALKVKNREDWRLALQSGKYDSQCKVLNNLKNGLASDGKNGKIDMVLDDTGALDRECHDAVTWDLSRALLQVEKMVEARCRKPPLESGSPTLICWESSLLSQPSSLSRVALHLSVLETSIMWSRSALFARCRICWRRGDAEKMLLCDSCDRGHHMYCLKPPLKTVPAGDWFCPTCRMKEVTVNKSKRKAVVVSNSSSEASANESSSEDDEEEEVTVAENSKKNRTNTMVSVEESSEDESDGEEDVRLNRGSKKSKNSTPRSLSKKLPAGPSRVLRSRIVDVPDASSPESACSASKFVDLESKSGNKVNERRSLDTVTSKRKVCAETDTDHQPKKVAYENSQILKSCENLVLELVQRDESWPFRRPIGRREVPGYHDIIRQPMDFSTVQGKLSDHTYNSPQEVLDDIRLIISNCSLFYSSPTSPERLAGQKLARHLERRVRELRLNSISSTEPQGAKVPPPKPTTRSRKKTV